MKSRYELIPVFLIFCGLMIAGQCGKVPGPLPQILTGQIRVTVMDTTLIDSVFIKLDDIALGQWSNPAILNDVTAGFHQLFVYNAAAAGTTRIVEVKADQIAAAWFWLTQYSPYIGFAAPDFYVTDLDGNPITLTGLRGKVVILAFFEFT